MDEDPAPHTPELDTTAAGQARSRLRHRRKRRATGLEAPLRHTTESAKTASWLEDLVDARVQPFAFGLSETGTHLVVHCGCPHAEDLLATLGGKPGAAIEHPR